MKSIHLRILCLFVILFITIRQTASQGNVDPEDLVFEPNRQVSRCYTVKERNLQSKDVFDGCKEAAAKALNRRHKHPDEGKSVEEMIERQGYPVESYDIFTEDGYILTLFRIPGTPENSKQPGKPVVLLMHGMLQSSESWFTHEGDRGLAFKLANHGFDVFLGNARGTKYSQGHRTLDPEINSDYWHFSWHELGVYDIPANIEKILEITEVRKIYYVGFSMGSTMYFVGLSERPELNNKIEAAILLSPVAYMGHSDSPVRSTAPALAEPSAKAILGPITAGRLDAIHNVLKYRNVSSEKACSDTAYLCGLCGVLAYYLAGFNPEQTNYTNLANVFSKADETVSVNSLLHYTQNINSCKFRKFNYGKRRNLKVYGSRKPPEYKLNKITVPTYFFQGSLDKFAYAEDVNTTRKHMQPGVVQMQVMIPRKAWFHFDFIAAKEADTLVFDKVVKILEMHVNEDVDLNEVISPWNDGTIVRKFYKS